MHDPTGRTDPLTMDVMNRIDQRLQPIGQGLTAEQRKCVWNSVWEVIYGMQPQPQAPPR